MNDLQSATALPRPVPIDHLLPEHAAQARPASTRPTEISREDLRRMIAEAAYYRALHRAFAPGYEVEDWLEAEQDILSGIRAWRQS